MDSVFYSSVFYISAFIAVPFIAVSFIAVYFIDSVDYQAAASMPFCFSSSTFTGLVMNAMAPAMASITAEIV